MTLRQFFIIFAITSPITTLIISYFWAPFLCVFLVLIPVIAVDIYDMLQTKKSFSDKSQRVANFHRQTVITLMELLGAAGLNSLEQLGT